MSHQTKVLGQTGESHAQHIFKVKGFEIKALNWRCGKLGEIDIIAFHPLSKVLVFAEVKTRKSNRCGTPEDAIDQRKQSRLVTLAEMYLESHPQDSNTLMRFDVVTLRYPGMGQPAEVHYIENAFEAN